MYGLNFSGGANKTHGQVERADRIDSSEAGRLEGRGTLHACRGNSAIGLQCIHSAADGREVIKPTGFTPLELTRIPSGFGGSRAFWLCPGCGKRVRYLYFKGRGFVCRECAKLNYRCQQRTRDSANYVQSGMKLAREKLHWEPPGWFTPLDFPDVTPPCPRYMHQATYQRHLARFKRYQEKYFQEWQKKINALLRLLTP